MKWRLTLSHLQLNVKNLEKSLEFYRDILGLIEEERDDFGVYLKGIEENKHHSLYLRESRVVGFHHFAVSFSTLQELQDALNSIEYKNQTFINKYEKGISNSVIFLDPADFPVEFTNENRKTKINHIEYLTKNIRALRLDHITLHTPKIEDEVKFYTSIGFSITEEIRDKDNKINGIFLSIRGFSHDLAFFRRSGPSVHHITIRMKELSDMIKVCDILGIMNKKEVIELSLGRHKATGGLSVYLRDPDGNRIEIFTEDYSIDIPNVEPIIWKEPTPMLLWGPEPPKSYYEEKTKVINPFDESLIEVNY
jgi:catechol 2,3-dioxygenase